MDGLGYILELEPTRCVDGFDGGQGKRKQTTPGFLTSGTARWWCHLTWKDWEGRAESRRAGFLRHVKVAMAVDSQ